MRDDLVGYLIGALDERDARDVTAALADPLREPMLREDLEILRRGVRLLDHDRDPLPPPAGLAARTVKFVAAQTAPAATSAVIPSTKAFSPTDGDGVGRRRAWLDRLIIGATAVAASILVAPLLLDAIAESRARRAERNLHRLSTALQGFAESHGVYPTPPDSGPLSRAGLYAPTLVAEERIVADDGTVLCPDSVLSRRGGFRVPSLEQLKAAVGTPQFEDMVRTMGGDYGYTLGHRDASGALQPNRNLRRGHHPLIADAPDDCCEKSSNHADGIHHVLFEDGHVETLRPDSLHREDHLYRNHAGKVAAGIDAEDAVIGDSEDQP